MNWLVVIFSLLAYECLAITDLERRLSTAEDVIMNRHNQILLFPSRIYKDTAVNGSTSHSHYLRLQGVIFQLKGTLNEENKFEMADYMRKSLVTKMFMKLRKKNRNDDDEAASIDDHAATNRIFRFMARLINSSNQQTIRLSVSQSRNYSDQIVFGNHRDLGHIDVLVNVNGRGFFTTNVPVRFIESASNAEFRKLYRGGVLLVKKDNIVSPAHIGNSNLVWAKASVHYSNTNSNRRAIDECPMVLMDRNVFNNDPIMPTFENQIQIISDIDDTVKNSGVNTNILNIVQKAIFQNYEVVPGMPELYKHIAKSLYHDHHIRTSFHFLSAVPWPLLPSYIIEFVLKHDFPWATFTSRTSLPMRSKKVHGLDNRENAMFSFQSGSNPREIGGIIQSVKSKFFAWIYKTKAICSQVWHSVCRRTLSRQQAVDISNDENESSETRSDTEAQDSPDASKEDDNKALQTAVKFNNSFKRRTVFQRLNFWSKSAQDDVRKRETSNACVYKVSQLRQMLDTSGWTKLLLFGDSTEADPEAYFSIADQFGVTSHSSSETPQTGGSETVADSGTKVQCIFIRYLPPSTADSRKVDADFRRFLRRINFRYHSIPDWKRHVRIFSDGYELFNIDLANGECHSNDSISVWDEANMYSDVAITPGSSPKASSANLNVFDDPFNNYDF